MQAGWGASASKSAAASSPPRTPASTSFPPPPRRTQPPQAQAPPKAGVPPTAKKPTTASRYSQFANREYAQKDEQSRAQAFKAWEQMKYGQATGQRGPAPEPPPRRPPPRPASYAPEATGQTGKARGGWDESLPQQAHPPADGFKRRPQMPGAPPRSPHKPSFFPGFEGGDEPPIAQQQSAYYNVKRSARPQAGARPQSQYFAATSGLQPGVPPGVRHVDPRVDPLKFFKQRPDERLGERISTPYATAGGEKTYFNSDSLNRSHSTGSNLHAGWDAQPNASQKPSSQTSFQARGRSASPMRSPHPPPAPGSSSSSSSSEDEDEVEPQPGRPRQKLRPRTRAPRRASADDRAYRQKAASFTYPNHPEVTVQVDESPSPVTPQHRSTWSAKEMENAEKPRHHAARKASEGAIPEGFKQHRLRVSPGRGGPASPSPLETRPGSAHGSNGQPMHKPKDWHEKFGASENGRHFERPESNEARPKSPGYGAEYGSFHYASCLRSFTSSSNPPLQPTSLNERSRNKYALWQIPSSISPGFAAQPHPTLHFSPLFGSAGKYANILERSFFFANDSSASSTKNSSAENIDAQFSAADWHDKFNDANDYLGPRPASSATRRGRSPPKPRPVASNLFTNSKPQASPLSMDTPRQQRTAPQQPRQSNGTNAAVPPPNPSPAKFQSDEWARTFKEPSWVYSAPKSAPLHGAMPKNTPRKMSAAASRRKAVPVPPPVNISAPDAEPADGVGPNPSVQRTPSMHSVASSGSAMDIDPKETTPPVDSSTPCMEQKDDPLQKIIRNAIPPTPGRRAFPSVEELEAQRAQPEESTATGHATAEATANGAEDSDSFESLSGLDTVPPIGPNDLGLFGMGDLATMLPFVSRSSATTGAVSSEVDSKNALQPPALHTTPLDLDIPAPPTPPGPPTRKLDASGWEQHVAGFERYLMQWHGWNSRMLSHFVARRDWALRQIPRGWTTGPGDDGVLAYLAGIEEDDQVRNVWDGAWAAHKQALKSFAKVKREAERDDLLYDS